MGRSVEFIPEGVLFKTDKKLNHFVFSNVLFSTIQTVIQDQLHFKLMGNEYQAKFGSKTHNVDCVMFSCDKNNPEITLIEFNGCFYHSCQLNNIDNGGGQCHLPPDLQKKDHQNDCPICTAAKQPSSRFRPSLWRLKSHETPNSIHPTLKKPHIQIANETSQLKLSLKASGQFKNVQTIKECDVLAFWSQPIEKFLLHFDFRPTPNLKTQDTLGTLFEKTLINDYPMFDSSKKLTTQRIINLIKSYQLFGLVVISGQAGNRSKQILKDFLPFSHIFEGKMTNSFKIEKQLITTNFFAYLLNNQTSDCLPDFILHKIHHIFVYPRYTGLPYQKSCNYISNLIAANKMDKTYLPLLKAVPNFYIGNMAYNPNSSPKCVLLTDLDLYGLPQTKNFLKCEHLANQYYFAHFSKNQMYANLGHNHIAVVQQGRMELIKLVFTIAQYLECEVKKSNTDGITLVSKCPFPPKKNPKTPSIFFLDYWLKPNLTTDQLNNYIDMKSRYFQSPSVCSAHKSDYLNALENKTNFDPQQCCIDFEPSNDHMKVKLEQFGTSCIITGKNQICAWDYHNNVPQVKCSGLKQRTVSNFLDFTHQDLTSLHVDISSL